VRVVSGHELRFAVVRPGRTVVVGRVPPCDLVLPTSTVSRSHFQVELDADGELEVTDLGSTNGTFVEGRRAEGAVRVPPGGRVEAGDVVLRIDLVTADELAHLTSMASQIATAGRDPLTGLVSRRWLDERLSPTEGSAQAPTDSLVFLDIDHFKTINDRFGHAAGDRVLAEVARLVQEGIRTRDTAVRYGGEEIVVVLDRCPLERAWRVAERLREIVEAHRWATLGVPDRAVTVSIGVAERRRGEEARAWLERADRALYEAKRRGRNAVRVAS
jgi:diguanylate cyclase (GGDEF)-like protein